MKILMGAATTVLLSMTFPTWADGGGKVDKPAETKTLPYNEKADAKAQVEAALVAAKRENRRVLIQWGANWCPWCRALHERFKTDPGLSKTLHSEYDVVLIDVGEGFFSKNSDLSAKYGADANIKKYGVPVLTVLDSDGKVLINQKTDPFETTEGGKKGHDSKKLQEFLRAQQAPPLKADDVLAAALTETAQNRRTILLYFAKSGSPSCLSLDAWWVSPEVAGILSKDFVVVKIDLERMDGAKEVFVRYSTPNQAEAPWFAALDSKGRVIVASDAPKSDEGIPAEEREKAHLVTILEKSKRRITDKEFEELRKSLTTPAKEQAPTR